jgi:hypothetical protein
LAGSFFSRFMICQRFTSFLQIVRA